MKPDPHRFAARLLAWSLVALGVLPSAGETQRILCVGNSITEGWPSSEPSYRLFTWDLCTARGLDFRMVGSRVGNYGGNGNATLFTRSPAEGWLFEAQRHAAFSGIFASQFAGGTMNSELSRLGAANLPDVAMVHIGSNDMGSGANATTTRNHISTMIDQLRGWNPGVTILLAKTIPHGPNALGNYSRVSELNALIPSLASSKTTAASPVIAVDHGIGFNLADMIKPTSFEPLDNFNLSPDNVHPNLAGQAQMGRRWFGSLQALLAPPTAHINSPSHGATASPGATVTVEAATFGEVVNMQLYANGELVGTDPEEPFVFNVPVPVSGPLLLSAEARDACGQKTTSPPVLINPDSPELQQALQGMAAWYRSDTGVEMSGAAVRRWLDLSGNNRHFFQRNPSDRPGYAANRFQDKPALLFNNREFLSCWDGMPVNGDYTKVVVLKLGSHGAVNNILSAGTSPNGAHALWMNSSNKAQLYRFGSNADLSQSYAVSSLVTPLDEVTTLVSTYQSANRNGRLYQDNVLGASATAFRHNSAASMQLGAYNSAFHLDAEVAEVIVYDRVLDAGERDALQSYIDARYKTAPNRPPVLAALPLQRVHPGEAVRVDAAATDPDVGQSLTYSLGAGLPGASISGATVTWPVPESTAPGSYQATLTATDNAVQPQSDSQPLQVEVVGLELTSILPTNGMHRLTWTGIEGRTYVIEAAGSNLVDSVWIPLTNSLPGTALVPGQDGIDIFRIR